MVGPAAAAVGQGHVEEGRGGSRSPGQLRLPWPAEQPVMGHK